MRSQSPSGLWNRQSSSVVEDPENPSGDNMEIEAGNSDGAPLLRSTSGDESSADGTSEGMFIYGHMALSLLFLVAASSIVPLFAAAENEAWRSTNIPYQKTAAGDVILAFRLNHPVVDPPTISSAFLIFTSIVVPLFFILSINLFNFQECKIYQLGRSQLHELRAGVCALLVSVALSESVTCTLKLYVSRHRPNFYQLCGFDIKTLQCMAPLSKVHEASLSFPSGHSSLSFCGMTFMMYFLMGRVSLLTTTSSISLGESRVIKLFPYKSLLSVLCCLVPWSYSFFVATSRIVDCWHHPSDVVAGTLLGIAAATVGYHAFYPSRSAVPGAKAGIPLSLQPQQ